MGTLPRHFGSTDTDEYLIRAITDDFIQHHQTRNISKLLKLFADDGRIMAPFHLSGDGKSGLREALHTGFSQYDQKNLKLTTIYVEVSGHIAFGFGSYSVGLKLPKGKRIDDHGKWLITLRRIATNWKIVAVCWNSDLPLIAFIRHRTAARLLRT